MSEKVPRRDTKIQARADATEARAAEAAAIRRRWITLGEVLAVIAICISALTLWNNWTERSENAAGKSAEAQRASSRAATLILVAANSGTRVLTLKPASSEQSVQSQTISFPGALGVAPVQTTGEARIEAGWFEHALKNARGQAHLPDDSRGDERLPVAIMTQFLVDGQSHRDIAVYDIGYSIAGHWLGGHSVALHGISLVSRVKSGSAQAKLDARWNRLFPHKN